MISTSTMPTSRYRHARARRGRELRLGAHGPPTAREEAGEEMHDHDQQDRADGRDNQLAEQAILAGVEQAEIADDEVGADRAKRPEHQVAQNTEARAAHRAADHAG